MRALFSPTATTVADPTYALDVCIGRIHKLCFEGERSWKRGLGCSRQLTCLATLFRERG
jgi:hypothetical protein